MSDQVKPDDVLQVYGKENWMHQPEDDIPSHELDEKHGHKHRIKRHKQPTVLAAATEEEEEKHLIESELLYTVNYLDVPENVAKNYLRRNNDDAYRDNCGKELVLPLFPPVLKPGIQYRDEFTRISRISTSVRVRRIVIIGSLMEDRNEIQKCKDLLAVCDVKMHNFEKRLQYLEEEMQYIALLDSLQVDIILH